MMTAPRLAAVALAGSLLTATATATAIAPARADELGRSYRMASDFQRLAYIEKVLSETRFKKESPARFRALALVGKECADRWDPKFELVFANHLASCIVMANHKVRANP